jgi:hypothetical protein
MSDISNSREIIAGGEQPLLSFEHLIPIARFLVEERGHMPLSSPETVGFVKRNGFRCLLTRRITEQDWAAVKDRFILPDSIGYHGGIIQDNLNRMQFEGYDEIITEDGVIPIEEWEARQQATAHDER